ncbi:hypothetical protein UFOVP63_49 [uncultured Caudovirales phage]|uniref:Uncharacterized protein n=1 Tax=uncultured Caudovirales phage TaxID=2100421 RepID=A0A6J5KVT9_9CAUD|nr:hypothetical protein UFOVP63_49 [uncultured Caudovirales phage]
MKPDLYYGSRVMFSQAWRDTYGITTGWMLFEQGTVLSLTPCGTATIAHVEFDNGCRMFIITSNLIVMGREQRIAA